MKSKQAVGQEQVGKRNATRELVGRWHAQRTERAKRKSLPIKAEDLHAGSNKVAAEMAREKSDNVIKLAMTAVAKDMQQMFAADEQIAEQQGIQRDVILQRAIAIRKNNARVTLDDEGLVPANVAYLEALEQFLMKKFDVKKVNDSISQTKRKFKTVFIAVNVGSAKRVEFHERKKEGRGVDVVRKDVDNTAAALEQCNSLAELTTTAARIRAVTQYKSGRGTPGGSSGGTGKGSKVWNATTLKARMAELHKRLSPEGVKQAAAVVVARAEQLLVNSAQRKQFHKIAAEFIMAVNSVLSMPQEDEAIMKGKKRTANAKSAGTHATRQATGNVRTMPKRKAA